MTDGESVRGFADQTVKATLKDGRVITKYTLDERIAMFKNTAARLGEDALDRLVDVALDLENHTVGDITALTN